MTKKYRRFLGSTPPGAVAGPTGAAQVLPPPLRRNLTPEEHLEFATFASQFDRSRKPVRFDGEHWKL